MNNRRLKFIPMGFLVAAISGCHIYWGVPIEGWVVDEKSKQPIKGAVVIATWETYGGVAHSDTVGNLLVQETVTDDRGYYAFESWGPRFVFWNYLDGSDPTLIVFHEDYYFWSAGDGDFKTPHPFTIETRGSIWSGKTIPLMKFDDDLEKFTMNAAAASLHLHALESSWPLACTWEKMPRLAAEIIKRGKAINHKRPFSGLPSESTLRGGNCTEPSIALRDYQ